MDDTAAVHTCTLTVDPTPLKLDDCNAGRSPSRGSEKKTWAQAASRVIKTSSGVALKLPSPCVVPRFDVVPVLPTIAQPGSRVSNATQTEKRATSQIPKAKKVARIPRNLPKEATAVPTKSQDVLDIDNELIDHVISLLEVARPSLGPQLHQLRKVMSMVLMFVAKSIDCETTHNNHV